MGSASACLLINPRAGRTALLVSSLIAKADELGIQPRVVGPEASVRQVAREAIEGGAAKLGIAGGDG